jgi:succinate dehydrogenase / fumarate reductase iron-sulfur subunit
MATGGEEILGRVSEYTLKIRRYVPESGAAPHWADFKVDLEGHRSVLDGILQVKDREDGSIGIRCSCQAAICGSCGVRINGEAKLACNTKLQDAAAEPVRISQRAGARREGEITVEPMGNMPVLKDLIVNMDAVHWKKVQRVVPWLLPEGDPPEREYVVPPETMIDVTQSMACIHCGACVSDCLSMEVDPLFIGPAALAKAYRFVGDPRDAQTEERLRDLAEDPHGIYDCTHCFNCVQVCPKGVAPMDQIMRLRRRATRDFEINDQNNGRRHEHSFTSIISRKGILDERKLLQDSLGPFRPQGQVALLRSLPTGLRGFARGKITPRKALFHERLEGMDNVRRIYDHAEEHAQEVNLYILGEGGEDENGAADGQAHQRVVKEPAMGEQPGATAPGEEGEAGSP